MKAHMGIPHQ